MECSGEIDDKVYVMYAVYSRGRGVFEQNSRYMICGRDFNLIPEDKRSAVMQGKQCFVFEEAKASEHDGFPVSEGKKTYVDLDTVITYLPLSSKFAERQMDPGNFHLAHKNGVFETLMKMIGR
jgi:hypothetical protein